MSGGIENGALQAKAIGGASLVGDGLINEEFTKEFSRALYGWDTDARPSPGHHAPTVQAVC